MSDTCLIFVFHCHLTSYLLEVSLPTITATLSMNLANKLSFLVHFHRLKEHHMHVAMFNFHQQPKYWWATFNLPKFPLPGASHIHLITISTCLHMCIYFYSTLQKSCPWAIFSREGSSSRWTTRPMLLNELKDKIS